MSKQVFTDKFLDALKPVHPKGHSKAGQPLQAGERAVYWDGKLDSFGVRMTDKGVASFFVMRRKPGDKQPTRVVLGKYPALSLKEARRKAGDAIDALARGEDAKPVKPAPEAAEADVKANTVKAVVHRFAREHLIDKKTGPHIDLRLEREVVSRWGDRDMKSITKADILKLVADVRADVAKRRKQPGIESARQTLTVIKSLFSWAAFHDIVESNPAAAIPSSGRYSKALPAKKPRERVLSDSEIKALWKASDFAGYPAGPFMRLLLVLGVRRSELALMTWDEADLDAAVWNLSGDRTKNEEPRAVPLPRMAVDILRELPRFTGPYVFTNDTGDRPIVDFDWLKRKLGRFLPGDMRHWTLHDLRRTMRTGLSAIGVLPLIAELCIGHKMKGVHGIYDRHRYLDEQRDALEKWCAKLRDITSPAPANVTKLPRRASA